MHTRSWRVLAMASRSGSRCSARADARASWWPKSAPSSSGWLQIARVSGVVTT